MFFFHRCFYLFVGFGGEARSSENKNVVVGAGTNKFSTCPKNKVDKAYGESWCDDDTEEGDLDTVRLSRVRSQGVAEMNDCAFSLSVFLKNI